MFIYAAYQKRELDHPQDSEYPESPKGPESPHDPEGPVGPDDPEGPEPWWLIKEENQEANDRALV